MTTTTIAKLSAEQLEQVAQRVACLVLQQIRPEIKQQNDDCMISRKELARRLKVSLATVDRLTSNNEIPSQLVGGQRRFRYEEVCEVLANRNGNVSPND